MGSWVIDNVVVNSIYFSYTINARKIMYGLYLQTGYVKKMIVTDN